MLARYALTAADRRWPSGTTRPSSFADALVARTPAALIAAFDTTTSLGVRLSINCDPTEPWGPLTTAFIELPLLPGGTHCTTDARLIPAAVAGVRGTQLVVQSLCNLGLVGRGPL